LDPATPTRQRGIQSVEVGGQLLRALAHHGNPMALKDLAREAGMAPAKAHPYLVSFGKLGLIEQDPASGRYGLGPLAMQLGLISLQQLDPIALATPVIEELAAATGLTAAIAVWGNRGATIVRIAAAGTPVHVSMRHGTVMSLRATASGRLFAAWLPKSDVLPLLKAEAAASGRRAPAGLDAAFAAELAQVRAAGFSRAVDLAMPGVSAIAAPVFDLGGRIVLAITVIGPTAAVDGGPQDRLAARLCVAARGISARLGARAAACPA
jgi:DNA-binding IclR family transcriptional regulator